MKYDIKYQHLQPLDAVSDIMRCGKAGECAICKKLTDFADLDYQCYVCSEECHIKLNEELGQPAFPQ